MLKADVPLALDVLSDILAEPTFDADELRREQNVIVQEIGAAEDAPDDLVFDRLQETAFPNQPVGRSILGTPETVRSFNPARLRAYLARNYRAPDMVVAAAGAVEHAADGRRGRAALRQLRRPGRAARRSRRISAAARGVETRDLEQVHIALALQGLPVRDDAALQPAGLHQRAGRRHVVAAVPGGAREARALLHDLRLPHALFRHRHVRLYAGTDEADAPELMRVAIDEIADATETLNEAEVARAKAQMKAGLLMALESSEARARAARPPDAGLRPADPARGDRRQGRRRDGRERARRRPRADRARPAGDRRARPRQRP